MALTVGAWCNWLAEYKKNKEFEDAVKASEKKVKDSKLHQNQHPGIWPEKSVMVVESRKM